MKKKTSVLTLNRETLRTLELAGVQGGVEIIPINYNLTQGCVSDWCIPQEPVDPNEKYRLRPINY